MTPEEAADLKPFKAKVYLVRLLGGLRTQVKAQDPEWAQQLLVVLMRAMDDELDCEDFFGTEGWRHLVMGED